MAHFEAYIHIFNIGIWIHAASVQKKEPEQFKHALLEFLVMNLPKNMEYFAIKHRFSHFLYSNPPSVIHNWKCTVMSIHNPLSFDLYDTPINAQNFDDIVDKSCKL